MILTCLLLCVSFSLFAQQQIDHKSLHTKINQNQQINLLDVRTVAEFRNGAIGDAKNISINDADFVSQVKSFFSKNDTLIVYCLAGSRSAKAVEVLKNEGFTNLVEYKGGYMEWKQNYVSEKPSAIALADYKKMISENDLVIIDFYAPWCIPCKKISPLLDELQKEFGGKLKVIKINADDNVSLLKELGITGIPDVTMFKKGNIIFHRKGIFEKEEIKPIIQREL